MSNPARRPITRNKKAPANRDRGHEGIVLKMERVAGVEPATFSLEARRATVCATPAFNMATPATNLPASEFGLLVGV